MAGEMRSCENCQKFLTCEVVKILQGGRCHPDWIKMGDRIGEICTGFSYCLRRGKEEKCPLKERLMENRFLMSVFSKKGDIGAGK